MTLLEAIALVQADPRGAPAEAWTTLRRRSSYQARGAGADREDVQQEAMISVLRIVDRGTPIPAPGALVDLATKRRSVDRWNRSRRYALDEHIEARPDLGATSAIERGAQDPQALVAAVLDAVEAEIKASRPVKHAAGGTLQTAAALRMQMRATLLRTMGRTTVQIRDELDVDASDALVSKWIERGRPFLLAAIDRISVPEAAAPAVEMLRTMAAARRADVGRPRKKVEAA